MTAPQQLPLDLGHRPALGREDFVVGPSNATAVGWIDRWPDWPQSILAICGPEGAGKSHLCRVWRMASGAIEVTADSLLAADAVQLLGDADAVVLDGCAAALAAQDEGARRLFHLYNVLKERGGSLLIAERTPPARWSIALPDLASRLGSIPAVEMAEPDEHFLQALLAKLFADRQLQISAKVVDYLLSRMERSFRGAQQVVEALDRAALAKGSRVTVALARRVLDGSPKDAN